MEPRTAEPRPSKRRWDLIGAALGLSVAVFDLTLFGRFGLDLSTLARQPTGWAVLGGFTLGYGALGYVIGRLVLARARILADGDRIRAQLDALESQRAQLVQSEKLAALGRVAAGIAHEVRNPLGVIRASASMLEEGFDEGSDDRRACAFIREEIDRLDGLITALLAYARPAAMSLGVVELPALIDRAAKLASEGRAIAIARDLPQSLPVLRADRDLLTQLVLDLLVNAAEAGATRVEIRARREVDSVLLEVADDGPGVAKEHEDRVLEPFFTTKASGTGLGLAMAARIAQAHGGSLQLGGPGARGDGGGACFGVRLPLEGKPILEAA